MKLLVFFTILIVCLVHSTQAWWGDDSNEIDDFDDYSPWGSSRGRGRFGGRRQRFNRWGSDEDDFDDDWNSPMFSSMGFGRMSQLGAPRQSFGRRSSQSSPSQSSWSSPNYLTGFWMTRDYDTPDFFDFFG